MKQSVSGQRLVLSCDGFSENTGIHSNTEVAHRIESELNSKKRNTTLIQTIPFFETCPNIILSVCNQLQVIGQRAPTTHRKSTIFSCMSCHHYKEMKQENSLFLSLLSIRKRILTTEALTQFSMSCCLQRCRDLSTVIKVVP